MVWACNVAALGPLRIVVRCSKMRAKAASRQLRLAFGGIYCAPCTEDSSRCRHTCALYHLVF
ncbi:hypothetical protein CQZ76_01420 [Anaplasma marginale]|nr:hypothetical protein CQZ76_01420 [Anaplasma marginale]